VLAIGSIFPRYACKPTNVLFSVKGLDDDSSCFKDQQADDSIQEDLPSVASSRNKKEKTLKRKISSVYMGQLSD
jgi:hypothetical protein